MQKSCSLNDFMEELTPWLDREHVKNAHIDGEGRLVLFFLDGMRHVYDINDCNSSQVEKVLSNLRERGIGVER